MWLRRRQRVAEIIRMQLPERIDITRRENGRNRTPADMSAAQLHERAQTRWQAPNVKNIAGRYGVEVANDDVRTGLM